MKSGSRIHLVGGVRNILIKDRSGPERCRASLSLRGAAGGWAGGER